MNDNGGNRMDDFNTMNQMYQTGNVAYKAEPIGRYTAKTFGWMFLGLLVTFLVSVMGYATGTIVYVFAVPYAIFVLAIAEVAVVIFLSARITKMSVSMARAMFFLYAVLNGVVFSAYFLIYNLIDMVIVFAATSLFFGVMALIGYVTKANLSKLRNFLFGGLIFLAAFWLLGIFINLAQFELMACTVGIFVFLLFTAYDTQKIKSYHAAYSGDPEMAKKASIFSALQLYLDFINLFLYLLRVLGRRR